MISRFQAFSDASREGADSHGLDAVSIG